MSSTVPGAVNVNELRGRSKQPAARGRPREQTPNDTSQHRRSRSIGATEMRLQIGKFSPSPNKAKDSSDTMIIRRDSTTGKHKIGPVLNGNANEESQRRPSTLSSTRKGINPSKILPSKPRGFQRSKSLDTSPVSPDPTIKPMFSLAPEFSDLPEPEADAQMNERMELLFEEYRRIELGLPIELPGLESASKTDNESVKAETKPMTKTQSSPAFSKTSNTPQRKTSTGLKALSKTGSGGHTATKPATVWRKERIPSPSVIEMASGQSLPQGGMDSASSEVSIDMMSLGSCEELAMSSGRATPVESRPASAMSAETGESVARSASASLLTPRSNTPTPRSTLVRRSNSSTPKASPQVKRKLSNFTVQKYNTSTASTATVSRSWANAPWKSSSQRSSPAMSRSSSVDVSSPEKEIPDASPSFVSKATMIPSPDLSCDAVSEKPAEPTSSSVIADQCPKPSVTADQVFTQINDEMKLDAEVCPLTDTIQVSSTVGDETEVCDKRTTKPLMSISSGPTKQRTTQSLEASQNMQRKSQISVPKSASTDTKAASLHALNMDCEAGITKTKLSLAISPMTFDPEDPKNLMKRVADSAESKVAVSYDGAWDSEETVVPVATVQPQIKKPVQKQQSPKKPLQEQRRNSFNVSKTTSVTKTAQAQASKGVIETKATQRRTGLTTVRSQSASRSASASRLRTPSRENILDDFTNVQRPVLTRGRTRRKENILDTVTGGRKSRADVHNAEKTEPATSAGHQSRRDMAESGPNTLLSRQHRSKSTTKLIP